MGAFDPHPAGALRACVGSQARLGMNLQPLPSENQRHSFVVKKLQSDANILIHQRMFGR